MAARYVSQSIKRQEDPPLLMGRARFIGDLRLHGLLAVKFLRSPHAHARIVRIDADKALALPGVRAVATSADFPEIPPEEGVRSYLSRGTPGSYIELISWK